jgi:hypothetical protein
MANWKSGPNAPLGLLTPGGANAAAAYPVGSIATFVDDILGSAEFVYGAGAAGMLIGDLAVLTPVPGAPVAARAVAGAANSSSQVGVASAAIGAAQFGWYQISGVAEVNGIAGVVAGPVFASATPGAVTSAAAAGQQVLGARALTALGTPSAGKAYVSLNRPFLQGQIA